MVTNAMFYRDPGDSTNKSSGIIQIGSLQISVNDLITGFISSFIVIIPVTLIIYIFVNSDKSPRTKIKGTNTATNKTKMADKGISSGDLRNTATRKYSTAGVHHIHEKKKYFSLPHWFIYVAWALVVLSVLVSAFFTLLYSFGWGKQKSTAWLFAFLFSNLSNAFFIEPLQVSGLHPCSPSSLPKTVG